MTVHPRLVRSVPFWTLIVGSAATIGAGAYLLVSRLGSMEIALTENTATGVDVYVGQVWAVFGGVLVGAGILGLALALAIAAARSLVPVHVDSIEWTDDDETDASGHTLVSEQPSTAPATAATATAPVAATATAGRPVDETHDEPAVVSTPDPESPETPQR